MSDITIIRQQVLPKCEQSSTVRLWGKAFDPIPIEENLRIIVHEDYPLVSEADLDEFIAFARTKAKIVISGRLVKTHPYRLMYIDDKGYDAFCFDIPQEIRGNRHLYPEIYEFVPALISIPHHLHFDSALDSSNLDMFVMPEYKLLDQSILIERLLMKTLRN